MHSDVPTRRANPSATTRVGTLLFSMLLTPVLTSLAYRKGAHEWRNPVLDWLTARYRLALQWAVSHRLATLGLWLTLLAVSVSLAWSGAIGSEFLPHHDECAIWARCTLPPSTGPSEGERVVKEARLAFASFPEVTQVVTQVGRPDDGTDTTGFFNTEYFVDLKPRDQWRPRSVRHARPASALRRACVRDRMRKRR